MNKDEIRNLVLEGRRALDDEEIALASQIICRKIMQTKQFHEAEDLCLYSPIRNEVDVMLLADIADEYGKRVWLPKTEGDRMSFRPYEGKENMLKGAFNIMEPVSGEVLSPDSKTLIIMPGAAFTEFRDRIGYGAGYYDRYLSDNPGCMTIGVCYDIQIVDEIPSEEHDIRPDYVICESAIFG